MEKQRFKYVPILKKRLTISSPASLPQVISKIAFGKGKSKGSDLLNSSVSSLAQPSPPNLEKWNELALLLGVRLKNMWRQYLEIGASHYMAVTCPPFIFRFG